MIENLLFYLHLDSVFLLLFLLDGEIDAQEWKDALRGLGFIVDEANANLRMSVQQNIQDFGEVVLDGYEIGEGNYFRVQAIQSLHSFSYIVRRDLIVIQFLVTFLNQTAPKSNAISMPTSNIDILMRVLSYF